MHTKTSSGLQAKIKSRRELLATKLIIGFLLRGNFLTKNVTRKSQVGLKAH